MIMTTYNIVKTINGHKDGQVLGAYDTIREARNAMYTNLKFTALNEDIFGFCQNREDAIAEIEWAEDSREDWGDECVEKYIAALNEGLDSELPFAASHVTGQCITIQDDEYRWDNYKVSIVEVETDDKIVCDAMASTAMSVIVNFNDILDSYNVFNNKITIAQYLRNIYAGEDGYFANWDEDVEGCTVLKFRNWLTETYEFEPTDSNAKERCIDIYNELKKCNLRF